jgi:hypothetical protein
VLRTLNATSNGLFGSSLLGRVRIVANRTDVIGHEPCSGLRNRIIRRNGIIRFSKARSVNEGEVTHIEKALYLAFRSGPKTTLSGYSMA